MHALFKFGRIYNLIKIENIVVDTCYVIVDDEVLLYPITSQKIRNRYGTFIKLISDENKHKFDHLLERKGLEL